MGSNLRSRLPAALTLGVLFLPGCDQWALSIDSNGLVFISIIGEGHSGQFRLRAQQAEGTQFLDVPASGRLSVSGLAPGAVELTLLLPPGCQVAGPNPQTLMVSSDQPVNAAFDVRCGA